LRGEGVAGRRWPVRSASGTVVASVATDDVNAIDRHTFAFHYYAPHLGLARLTWRDGWPMLAQLRIARV
jgi:hypothetical protein